ncbi:MAG: IS21-like element helper ATPase IstB [Bacillota bacterium]
MLVQPTLEKLRAMHLLGMAEALAHQSQQPDMGRLSFEERLGLLVDEEWTYRQNRRLQRLLKEAKLRLAAVPEDIDYTASRGLDRPTVQTLLRGEWIRSHQSVLISGPTGVGKTFLACALAHAACRQGFSARYYRLSRLLSELALARADGSYPKRLAQLGRTEVLVLDDWGLAPLNPSEGRELLEVIDDRAQRRATIVASQLPIENWHGVIADPSIADAILGDCSETIPHGV